MKTLLLLVIFISIIILVHRSSSYTASTPAGDRVSQPINIGKDINTSDTATWSTTTYKLDAASSTKSWDDLNKEVWNRTGCVGFRKELAVGGGGNVYYLYTTPTAANMNRDATVIDNVTLSDGNRYAIPSAVVALKSVANPIQAADCQYTIAQGTACSATVCDTTGTYTDKVTVTTPAVAEGTCPYTNGQTLNTRACSAPPCPRNCYYTITQGTACSATQCGTSGFYIDTVNVQTPESNGGTCPYTNGQQLRTRACSAPVCSWVPSGYFTGALTVTPTVTTPVVATGGGLYGGGGPGK